MGRPRKSSLDEATIEQLRRAGENIFGAQGYHGARLDDVAQAIGVTRQAILYHFKSKGEFYKRVVQAAFGKLQTHIGSAIIAGETFDARLESVMDSLFAFFREHPGLAGIIVREFVEQSEPDTGVMESFIIPTIDVLEAFVSTHLGEKANEQFSVRTAVVTLAMSNVMRTASGGLADRVWGPEENIRQLIRVVLLNP